VRSTVPPSGAVPAPGVGWGVRRAEGLVFPHAAAIARDPTYASDLAVYLTDLLRQHGLAIDHAALAAGGQSYKEMAEALIGRIVPDGERIDLLVLAYAVPDVIPGRATCVYLSGVCPGTPLAFAVSDQGTAAAFTALRLIRQYAGASDLRRALLIVLEQAWLPYDPATPAALPTGHSGVAVLFGDADQDCPARLESVATHTPTAVSALPAAISALAAESTRRAGTVIVGSLLAEHAPEPAGVRRCPAGRPYTGVWWELVGELSQPHTEPRRLVLADYDPESRTLGLAAIDVGRTPGNSAPEESP
jgi:hypothetical protein